MEKDKKVKQETIEILSSLSRVARVSGTQAHQ